MLEQNDEWAVTRRYMSLETVAQVCESHYRRRKNCRVMIIRETLPETPNYTTPRGTIIAAVRRKHQALDSIQ